MANGNFDIRNLDFGSNPPIAADIVNVEVEIDSQGMVKDYAEAWTREAERKNPALWRVVGLTKEEMVAYVWYLMVMRVKIVNNERVERRFLSQMYIPAYIQQVLALIGEVTIRDKGLVLKPVVDLTEDESANNHRNPKLLTDAEALAISEKIGAFEDHMYMMKKAMPLDIEGDREVMTTALIAGYVRSMEKLSHPALAYISAFLNFKLREEGVLSILYRVRYDDIEYIRLAMMHQKGLY